jgi:hypothetical protein
MKLAVSAFFLLLLGVHMAGDIDCLLGTPLSQLRDEPLGGMGYLLFAMLLVVGVLYTRALWQSGREAEANICGLAMGLLVVVAATSSFSGLHLLCAVLLLLLLFSYYAVLLHRAGSLWFIVHLTVPLLLVALTRFHSYGLWQKSFILYCVIAAATHHHLLGRPAPREGRVGRRARPHRRRKVYTLDEGRGWTRHPARSGET